jgi:hypothetical protein
VVSVVVVAEVMVVVGSVQWAVGSRSLTEGVGVGVNSDGGSDGRTWWIRAGVRGETKCSGPRVPARDDR